MAASSPKCEEGFSALGAFPIRRRAILSRSRRWSRPRRPQWPVVQAARAPRRRSRRALTASRPSLRLLDAAFDSQWRELEAVLTAIPKSPASRTAEEGIGEVAELRRQCGRRAAPHRTPYPSGVEASASSRARTRSRPRPSGAPSSRRRPTCLTDGAASVLRLFCSRTARETVEPIQAVADVGAGTSEGLLVEDREDGAPLVLMRKPS